MEDISDEKYEKVIDSFYDNYHEYIITYVMLKVIAYYIANSYSRNAMWEATFLSSLSLYIRYTKLKKLLI